MTRVARQDFLPPPARQPAAANRKRARGMVIHYPGVPQAHYQPDDADAATIINGWYTDHVKRRGWRDVGYNFVIAPSGTVFEARGWGSVPGAHAVRSREQAKWYAGKGPYQGMTVTQTYNTQRSANWIWPTAVNLIVGAADSPTEPQKRAVQGLYEEMVGKGLGEELWGHRELAATSCPGDPTQTWINGLGRIAGVPTIVASSGPGEPATPNKQIPGDLFTPTDLVARLQEELGGLTVDGLYGPRTRARHELVRATIETFDRAR